MPHELRVKIQTMCPCPSLSLVCSRFLQQEVGTDERMKCIIHFSRYGARDFLACVCCVVCVCVMLVQGAVAARTGGGLGERGVAVALAIEEGVEIAHEQRHVRAPLAQQPQRQPHHLHPCRLTVSTARSRTREQRGGRARGESSGSGHESVRRLSSIADACLGVLGCVHTRPAAIVQSSTALSTH